MVLMPLLSRLLTLLVILTMPLFLARLTLIPIKSLSICLDRKSGSAGMPRPISYAVFCLKKENTHHTCSSLAICSVFFFNDAATTEIYTLSLHDALPIYRHVYGEQWIKFMKDGVNATPLPTVNTTGYIDHAAFLGTINPDTNKIPKHLFQGYLNIYNNYFKAPW